MLRPDGRPSRRRRRAMLREACVNIALTMLAVALSAASLMVAVKVARECPGGPVTVAEWLKGGCKPLKLRWKQ